MWSIVGWILGLAILAIVVWVILFVVWGIHLGFGHYSFLVRLRWRSRIWKRERQAAYAKLLECRDELEPSVRKVVEDICRKHGVDCERFRRSELDYPNTSFDLTSWVQWYFEVAHAYPRLEIWIQVRDKRAIDDFDKGRRGPWSGWDDLAFRAGTSSAGHSLTADAESVSTAELQNLLGSVLSAYPLRWDSEHQTVFVSPSHAY